MCCIAPLYQFSGILCFDFVAYSKAQWFTCFTPQRFIQYFSFFFIDLLKFQNISHIIGITLSFTL